MSKINRECIKHWALTILVAMLVSWLFSFWDFSRAKKSDIQMMQQHEQMMFERLEEYKVELVDTLSPYMLKIIDLLESEE